MWNWLSTWALHSFSYSHFSSFAWHVLSLRLVGLVLPKESGSCDIQLVTFIYINASSGSYVMCMLDKDNSAFKTEICYVFFECFSCLHLMWLSFNDTWTRLMANLIVRRYIYFTWLNILFNQISTFTIHTAFGAVILQHIAVLLMVFSASSQYQPPGSSITHSLELQALRKDFIKLVTV